MRVFARTARPIGGVQIATPTIDRDYTAATDPLALNVTATVVDEQHQLLSGSAPLEIRLVDPLGDTRYSIYRATTAGVCQLRLPMAANDPPGTWKLSVRELLAGHETTATFTFAAPPQCGALAGTTSRAVVFGNDRENIFRLLPQSQASDDRQRDGCVSRCGSETVGRHPQALGSKCKIVAAADVNKPREVAADEAPTFAGIEPTGHGQITAGRGNSPEMVGYDIAGATILLGSPDDNPLIRTLVKRNVLPYAVSADFPGRNRGMLAWQLDIIRPGEESIALIATDAAGLEEAVGSLYEAAAAMEPLTPWDLPSRNSITPASQPATRVHAMNVVWQVILPDRAAVAYSRRRTDRFSRIHSMVR